MRILRLAGMLVALAAALGAVLPAAADGAGASIDLTVGWTSADTIGGSAAAPSWVPFTTVISIPGGHGDFSGTLIIRPRANGPGNCYAYGCGGYGITYQEAVTIRPGAPRTLTVYGQYDLNGPPATYEAVLLDAGGTTVASSGAAALRPNYLTVGVLSDAAAADSLFRGVSLGQNVQGQQVRGHRFDRVETFPSSPLALSGFHAIVIDDFDVSTLSQAQLRALVDYVGFGGSLVVTGGAGWRTGLAQLPASFVALKPEATGSTSLRSLAELTGGSGDVSAPIATGILAPAARALVTDAAGTPLLAELDYGAGRVLELMYDPALDPVIGTPLGVAAWAVVLNRATASARLPTGGSVGPAPVPIAAGSAGSALPPGQSSNLAAARYSAGEAQIFSVLANSPASAVPPLTLLGALLVGYVILAGPANYLLVRRRRRELMWVTLPLLAVLFTGIAYGAGMAYKGSDFLVNEIQLLRLAPGGSADATTFDALFNSRRGDFLVQGPDGAFATTTTFGQYGPLPSGAGDRVRPGRRPGVALNGVPVWGERNVKVEAAVRSTLSLEAHLALVGGHVRGAVTNRGPQTVRNLALLTVSGEWAVLASAVPGGSTVSVDAPLGAIPPFTSGVNPCNAKGSAGSCAVTMPAGVSCPPNASCATFGAPAPIYTSGPSFQPGAGPLSDAGRRTLAEVAAASSVMTRSDVQALVGTVEPLPGITIRDQRPTVRSISAVAQPVVLESMDVLPAGWAGAQLVSSLPNGQTGTSLNVWDFVLPSRVDGPLVLQYGTPGVAVPVKPGLVPNPTGPVSVETYDWSSRSWRKVPTDARCAAGASACMTLSAGEAGTGMIRIRVRNSPFYNFQVQVLSAGVSAA